MLAADARNTVPQHHGIVFTRKIVPSSPLSSWFDHELFTVANPRSARQAKSRLAPYSICPYAVAVSPEFYGKVLLQFEGVLPGWYRVILPVESRPKSATVPPHETVR